MGGQCHPRLHVLNEHHNAMKRIPLHELLFREAPEVSKTMQAIVTALGYPPQIHGKILLLKAPHMLPTGHGEISHTTINKFSNAAKLSQS